MIEALNLIKKKIYGTIKGIICTNGSEQRRYFSERESIASPTVSLEALFTTLITDIYEERDVATFDVSGAYLHAKMTEGKTILLKLRWSFLNIMCDINP